jgi:hypothetical protein
MRKDIEIKKYKIERLRPIGASPPNPIRLYHIKPPKTAVLNVESKYSTQSNASEGVKKYLIIGKERKRFCLTHLAYILDFETKYGLVIGQH